jgi:hypothetical protein
MKTAVEWLLDCIPVNLLNDDYIQAIFKHAKEMEEKQAIDKYSNVSRLEVIQHSDPYNGRAYTNYNAKDVDLQIQDEGKTLKIFLK